MVEVLRLALLAQDFACGLRRPQSGSSSTPTASTNNSPKPRYGETIVQTATSPAPVSKGALWTGRVLSALAVLVFVGGGIFTLLNAAKIAPQMAHYGFNEGHLHLIAWLEIVCGVVYLIPQTAIFGAVLLTGDLGGAVVTHIRAGEPPIAPSVVACVVWLGIYLREPRLRAISPLRK